MVWEVADSVVAAHPSVSAFLNSLTRLKCESQTANSDLNDQNEIQPAETRTPSTRKIAQPWNLKGALKHSPNTHRSLRLQRQAKIARKMKERKFVRVWSEIWDASWMDEGSWGSDSD